MRKVVAIAAFQAIIAAIARQPVVAAFAHEGVIAAAAIRSYQLQTVRKGFPSHTPRLAAPRARHLLYSAIIDIRIRARGLHG